MKRNYNLLLHFIFFYFIYIGLLNISYATDNLIESKSEFIDSLFLKSQPNLNKVALHFNPDWLSIPNYTVPVQNSPIEAIVPHQIYSLMKDNRLENDTKIGMYVALVEGHKYFLKEYNEFNQNSFGEILAFNVSDKINFNLVPPTFILSCFQDIEGIRLSFDDNGELAHSFKVDNLKGKTFIAQYFVEGKTFYTYLANDKKPIPFKAIKDIYQSNIFRGILAYRDYHLGNFIEAWGRLILVDNESCFELSFENIKIKYLESFLGLPECFMEQIRLSKESGDKENIEFGYSFYKNGPRFNISSKLTQVLQSKEFWQNIILSTPQKSIPSKKIFNSINDILIHIDQLVNYLEKLSSN